MKTILALSRSDFYSTYRDPVFRGLLFFPLLIIILIRWVYPVIVAEYPEIEAYSQIILMWACLQTAIMFGFLYGFLMLEEKEERIWQAIRILPVSDFTLIASRLLLGFLISTAVNFILLQFGGIIFSGFSRLLMLSVLFSLSAPLIALYIAAFSKNRIEGLAQMKILNLLLIIPGIMYFFPWKLLDLLAVVPTYWSFKALEHVNDSSQFLLFFCGGLMFHILIIVFLNRRISRSIAE